MRHLKKILTLVSLTSTLAINSAEAITSLLISGTKQKQPEEKTKQKSSSKSQNLSETNIKGQTQPKTTPISNKGGWIAQADFLYWNANEENLAYGFRGQGSSTFSDTGFHTETLITISSHILNLPKKWNPGLKLKTGYIFDAQDKWELGVTWTYFKTRQKDSSSLDDIITLDNLPTTQPSQFITSTYIPSSLGTIGSGSWHLNYNTYDLDLSRNYFIGKTISLNPFLGVRGITIHQKYLSKITNGLTLAGDFLNNAIYKSHIKTWGLGMHLGTNINWYCIQNLSLIGQLESSLLYGHEKTDSFFQREITEVDQRAHSINQIYFKNPDYMAIIGFKGFLGFQWDQSFSQKRKRWYIRAGYEWNYWLNQNLMTLFPIDGNNSPPTSADKVGGDLSLQGLTLEGRLDF